jgi:hypothetical protein
MTESGTFCSTGSIMIAFLPHSTVGEPLTGTSSWGMSIDPCSGVDGGPEGGEPSAIEGVVDPFTSPLTVNKPDIGQDLHVM